ncbi:MAG: 23S rRNA (adenine(2503)-C(2))-methyltransferase RlmN, partial [Alistipes sp.]|nr:23S rRNA (adenine(2503)-C(2))-methyltransferase RlmN [Alistipes sp.]
MADTEFLYGRSPDELAAVCGELGMPRFAARQLARWLYAKHTEDPAAMSDLAALHRAALAERFRPALSAPVRVAVSADGTK